MVFNLNGLLNDYHFISADDKAKRDSKKRAQAADEASKSKEDDGFDLGGMLSNVLSGTAKTASDISSALTPQGQITTIGHAAKQLATGKNPLGDLIETAARPLSGRRYAENFGASQQLERLPGPAQTAIDVAPAVVVGAFTGGATEAPTVAGLGGAFLKSLALNTGINLGLQKGSEAAEDVPGWRDLDPATQNALIMAGTVGLSHGASKLGSKSEIVPEKPAITEPVAPAISQTAPRKLTQSTEPISSEPVIETGMPEVAGGASRWRTLFHEGPVSTLNNTLRTGHVLLDLATFGRLGPQVALLKPGEYSTAMKAAAKGIVQGRQPVKDAWAAIDTESAASGGVLPTLADWRKAGLSLHTPSTGLLGHIPGVRNLANSYQNFLDVLRPQIANEELRNRLVSGKLQPGDPNALSQVAKGTNLLTGSSSLRMGKEANLLLEFPNWVAAQGEMIVKAFTSGHIDGQMARASLTRLIGVGTLVTYGVNAINEGDPNPIKAITAHTRNGIPQLLIPGTNVQVDMYGPLGELISKTLGIGKGGVKDGPGGALAAAGDTYRGFASPVAKIGADLLTKSTVAGERVSTPEEQMLDIINNALPFATTEIAHAADHVPGVDVPDKLKGTRSQLATTLGSAGIRVHEPSVINRALDSAGISKSDPDYLIKRKEYLQAHPELRITNDVTDLQTEIQQSRQQLSDQLTSPGSTLDLVHFRDERTKILQKQRDVLGVLLGDQSSNPLGDSQQAKWLASYNQLFAASKDPKSASGGIDQNKLDSAIAKWTNDNGQQALDFVNRYTGTGLSTAEAAYIGDLRKLDAEGYFTTQKDQRYIHLKSSLTPDQIDAYHDEAESIRLSQRAHQKPLVAILKDRHPELTSAELGDIVRAGSTATANPAYSTFKAQHAKELLWFNPKATWETYTATRDDPKARPR